MKRVLFVCTGNTCRSPMVQAVFNRRASERGICAVSASAGISAFTSPVSEGAQEALADIGIDNFSHTATRVDGEMISAYDYIIGMTTRHAGALTEAFPDYAKRIFAFPSDISDPYGLGKEEYLKALSEIQVGVEAVLDAIEKDTRINILPLQKEHIDGLCKIEEECFSEPWSRASLESLLTTDYAVYFVALEGDTPVGYVGLYTSFEVGAINNIGVLPSHRGRKIGSMLLERLIRHCKENGITTLELEVRRSNTPAIRLYEKAGFVLCGERRGFYRKPTEDALLYNLEL